MKPLVFTMLQRDNIRITRQLRDNSEIVHFIRLPQPSSDLSLGLDVYTILLVLFYV